MDNLYDKVVKVTQKLEDKIDKELDKLNNLNASDLEQLRAKRLKDMKTDHAKRMQNIKMGHGQYEQLKEEKEFFEVVKKSSQVICHFYTESSERCKIVDMHFKKLAPEHIETKFCNLNIEKCPFLAEKLKVKIIPTVLMIRDQIVIDRLVGFGTLGNCDDFSTEMLEWRLGQNQAIIYDGDLSTPPDPKKISRNARNGKIVRDGEGDSESEDEFMNFEMVEESQHETELK